MRIFTAAFGTETNTFSPLPTGRASFAESMLVDRDASLTTDYFFALPLKAWRQRAVSHGDEIFEGLAAFAQPAGVTVQGVWEELRDRLLDDLDVNGPFDVVLLHLHGAMVSSACDDCEGELLERVRTIVGPDVVIGVELDLHCNISDRMMSNATALVLYKEYPHTDLHTVGLELFDLCRKASAGETSPVMSLVDCRMLGIWRTSDAQVRGLVDWMKAQEARPGIISMSFCHGFPWADVPDVGAKALAIADGDKGLADGASKELADRIFALRTEYAPQYSSLDDSVAMAKSASTFTVFADTSDNAGGGAASEATFILRAFLDSNVQNALFGLHWDPVAVRICEEAGEGATLGLRIGGKVGPLSGDPVDMPCRVVGIVREATQTFGDGKVPMGTAVLLDLSGIHLVITSIRVQTFHPDAFTQFGIDIRSYSVVVVKSMQHFHAGFSPIGAKIVYIAAKGGTSADFKALKFTKVKRSLWPLCAPINTDEGL